MTVVALTEGMNEGNTAVAGAVSASAQRREKEWRTIPLW
jgi:hypothetical protein